VRRRLVRRARRAVGGADSRSRARLCGVRTHLLGELVAPAVIAAARLSSSSSLSSRPSRRRAAGRVRVRVRCPRWRRRVVELGDDELRSRWRVCRPPRHARRPVRRECRPPVRREARKGDKVIRDRGRPGEDPIIMQKATEKPSPSAVVAARGPA
jgi:hypothetical protein